MGARDIANTLDVETEKDAMLQSIANLRSEVRRLSDTVSQKIGLGSKTEDLRSIVDDVFKKNKGKSVDQIAADLLANYKKTRQEEREETQAQIKASFSIFEEKMKSPLRSLASDVFNSFAKNKSIHNERDVHEHASDAVTSSLKSIYSGISKLLAPEKITKQNTDKDAGANNPNFNKRDESASFKNDDRAKYIKLLKSIKEQQKIDTESISVIDYAIKQLEGTVKNRKEVEDKKKTISDRAKEIEQAHYDSMNDDKTEALADWKAKQEIFKEKYKPSNIIRSLASDAFSSMANNSSSDYGERDVVNNLSDAFSSKLKYSENLIAKKFQPQKPSKEDKEQDGGQDNPNFSRSLGSEIKKDLADIKDSISDNREEDENDFESLYDQINGNERKISKDRDNLNDIENGIFGIDQYIRHQLVNKIVSELQNSIKSSTSQNSQSANTDDEDEEDDEEDDSTSSTLGKWKNRFRRGKLGARKAARFLKSGGRMALNAGRAGLGMAGGALQTLGGGAAASGGSAGMAMAGGAAVLALGAASAYTFYKTGETAATIIGNKSDVRDSTKGSSEASIARNKEKLTKDSDEVKKSIPRYKNAGMSEDEASSSALAERQNTKMLTTSASMGGIFTAAKNSTDFRTSEEEMGKLTEGEMLADTIGNVLRMLQGTLSDPNQLKNKSPQEIKNLSNQAKIAVKQIGDLKKTWEDAKKLGSEGMDSPWLNDKNMVSNGDAVINSLVESSGDIEKSFDDWAQTMQNAASKRSSPNVEKTSKKDNVPPQPSVEKSSKNSSRRELYDRLKSEGKLSEDPDIAVQQMMAEERIQNIQKDADTNKSPIDEGRTRTGSDLDDALNTGKMKPPKGYIDPSDSLKDKIGSVDKDTKPAIAKIGDDIKGAISGHTESLGSKIDILAAKIESLTAKKPTTLPQQFSHAPDMGFANINSISKGS